MATNTDYPYRPAGATTKCVITTAAITSNAFTWYRGDIIDMAPADATAHIAAGNAKPFEINASDFFGWAAAQTPPITIVLPTTDTANRAIATAKSATVIDPPSG